MIARQAGFSWATSRTVTLVLTDVIFHVRVRVPSCNSSLLSVRGELGVAAVADWRSGRGRGGLGLL